MKKAMLAAAAMLFLPLIAGCSAVEEPDVTDSTATFSIMQEDPAEQVPAQEKEISRLLEETERELSRAEAELSRMERDMREAQAEQSRIEAEISYAERTP